MSWAIVSVGVSVAGTAVSANNASKARKSASKAAKNELNFAKEQYADWLDAFGDIQENLSEYYEQLTPEFFETQALQAFEQEKDLAFDQLQADLEQRGLATSGLNKELLEDFAVQSAAERARIRAEAPLRSAQAQQEFLQIGLGQNPASNVQDALANRATQLSQNARVATQASAEAAGATIDTTFTALEKLLQNDGSTTGVQGGAPVGNPNNSASANIA